MQQAGQGICEQTLCSWHTRSMLSRTLAGALVFQALPAPTRSEAGRELKSVWSTKLQSLR